MNPARASSVTAPLTSAFERGSVMKRELLRMEGGSLSPTEFSERIGLTLQELEHELVFHLTVDGGKVYPSFQIADGHLIPGINDVLAAFTVDDPWMQVNFMLTGDRRLGGRRPIDLLREGRIDEVVRAAAAYGEHGSA